MYYYTIEKAITLLLYFVDFFKTEMSVSVSCWFIMVYKSCIQHLIFLSQIIHYIIDIAHDRCIIHALKVPYLIKLI